MARAGRGILLSAWTCAPMGTECFALQTWGRDCLSTISTVNVNLLFTLICSSLVSFGGHFFSPVSDIFGLSCAEAEG